MPELVSIITPCYNAANLISQTIQSVINQTYKNWEMVIVDDCSSDSSSIIIQEYAAIDSRIRYFKTSEKSGSPSLPRNIGLENAKGKFIAFLDSDDIWMPDKLENQVSFLLRNNYSIGYTYYEKVDWNGNRNNRVIKTRKTTYYNDLLCSNSIPCLTSIIRRELIGDTRFKQIPQEDFCFWLDILKKGHAAHNMCQVTALYREAPSSRSANKIDMFKGYWNVIRNYQGISLLKSCFYMVTYSLIGIAKYLK